MSRATYPRRWSVETHNSETHMTDEHPKYQCTQCGQVFEAAELNRHYKTLECFGHVEHVDTPTAKTPRTGHAWIDQKES